MGSNMAEAHPVGFQWVMEAKANDATVIHVDPRFTRTSALSDLHVPLRVGTDIAFLGGVINYILTNDLDFREYVLAYTNASFLIGEGYQDTDENGEPLRRTMGLASLGGATLDNEENYLIKKLFTALGALQIENQARI